MTDFQFNEIVAGLFAGFDQETNDRDMATARAAEATRIAAVKADNAAPMVRTRSIGCHRCGGKGYLPAYQHIKGGECFACNIYR